MSTLSNPEVTLGLHVVVVKYRTNKKCTITVSLKKGARLCMKKHGWGTIVQMPLQFPSTSISGPMIMRLDNGNEYYIKAAYMAGSIDWNTTIKEAL